MTFVDRSGCDWSFLAKPAWSDGPADVPITMLETLRRDPASWASDRLTPGRVKRCGILLSEKFDRALGSSTGPVFLPDTVVPVRLWSGCF
jgi:hypothetical protein